MTKRILTQVKKIKVFSPEKTFYIGMSGNDHIDFQEVVFFNENYENEKQVITLLEKANKIYKKKYSDTWQPKPTVEIYWETLTENEVTIED